MKNIPLFSFVFLCLFIKEINAQKNIKGLINAEKQFAAYTAAHDIKQGFLKNLDKDGIVFVNGEPKNGIAVYLERQPNGGILSWQPELAVISSSGDLGFTTGPYEFRLKSLKDTPVARGNFSSIWRINSKGEWKLLNDIGVQYAEKHLPVTLVKQIDLSAVKGDAMNNDDVIALDKKMNLATQKKDMAAFEPFITKNTWFNINGHLPVTGMQLGMLVLNSIPAELDLEFKGGSISLAKDLAYTFGKVNKGSKNSNYMRVWMYKNNQWVLLLQVLNW